MHDTAPVIRSAKTEAALSIADECVHFGFCVSVCPTYVLTRDEDESPRGRIDLIQAMLSSDAAPPPDTVRHVDQCLSCLSCMSTCAARVDYAHLIDEARAHIEDNYKRPWPDRFMRRLVAAVIPHPRRLRFALALAKLGRPVAGLLGSRIRGMAALATQRTSSNTATSANAGIYPAHGTRRMRVALLPGCAQQVLAPHINAATIRVLTRHQCEVIVPTSRCCGALAGHMGRMAEGSSAAAETLDIMLAIHRTAPLDAIVVTASGCGTTMKDYAHLFAHDAQRLASAREVAALTKDITEVLAELELPEQPRNAIRVAYHDACSLQHGQQVRTPPRAVLQRVGFELVPVPEAHFCCGSAGTYNLLQPETASQLGARKAAHIDSTAADVACAGNLGCLTQLDGYLNTPIVHTVELVDWATGGPRPASWPTQHLRNGPLAQ